VGGYPFPTSLLKPENDYKKQETACNKQLKTKIARTAISTFFGNVICFSSDDFCSALGNPKTSLFKQHFLKW
jgi:hypothetical protein